MSDAPDPPQHIEIEHLHALSCPRRPAEKFQARCDARVVVEAADIDPVAQALPAIEIDQLVQQLFQRQGNRIYPRGKSPSNEARYSGMRSAVLRRERRLRFGYRVSWRSRASANFRIAAKLFGA